MSRSVRRSEMAARSARAMAQKSAAKASGWPWKLPVEATSVAAGVGQHDRVVGHRGQFPLHDAPGEGDHVPAGAVDLRGAAERVGVLHGVVGRAVAGHDLRAGQQAAEVGRAALLAGMGADGVELGPVGGVGAEQRLDGDGAGHVGGGGQPVEVGQRQAQVGQHPLGAVEERQALLGLQHHRLEPGGGQPVGARQATAVGIDDLARAGEDGTDVGQGRQVAGCAEAAELGDDRGDARRTAGRPVPRPAPGRAPDRPAASVRARSSIIARTTSASTGSPIPAAWLSTSDSCRRRASAGDTLHRGQRPEAGGHAVDRRSLGHDPLDDRPGRSHACGRLGAPR